jgi:hypothetical protein
LLQEDQTGKEISVKKPVKIVPTGMSGPALEDISKGLSGLKQSKIEAKEPSQVDLTGSLLSSTIQQKVAEQREKFLLQQGKTQQDVTDEYADETTEKTTTTATTTIVPLKGLALEERLLEQEQSILSKYKKEVANFAQKEEEKEAKRKKLMAQVDEAEKNNDRMKVEQLWNKAKIQEEKAEKAQKSLKNANEEVEKAERSIQWRQQRIKEWPEKEKERLELEALRKEQAKKPQPAELSEEEKAKQKAAAMQAQKELELKLSKLRPKEPDEDEGDEW